MSYNEIESLHLQPLQRLPWWWIREVTKGRSNTMACVDFGLRSVWNHSCVGKTREDFSTMQQTWKQTIFVVNIKRLLVGIGSETLCDFTENIVKARRWQWFQWDVVMLGNVGACGESWFSFQFRPCLGDGCLSKVERKEWRRVMTHWFSEET